MDKHALRREIAARKRAMTAPQIADCSRRLAARLFRTDAWKSARSVYAYLSYNQEVRTDGILRRAWAEGKRVAVPKVFGSTMRFLWLERLEDAAPGAYGIREPVADGPEADDPEALVLMPGLAFDPQGRRCGYGGGFYDQWLAAHPGHPTAALCYGFQLFPALDTETHDIPVDQVIAEPVVPASNYDKLILQWAGKTAAADWSALTSRLPELQPADGGFSITHFGRRYRIDCASGAISADDAGDVSRDAALNIYTLLGYCRDGAANTGIWVPFRDVPGAGPFAPAFQKGVLQPFARRFAGRTDALRAAAAALGGTSLPQSDAGFTLRAFDCIPMEFLFWDGDAEFPAQANILYDRGVTGFIHVESTVSLASEGLARLAEAAGLPPDKAAF